MFRDLLTYLLTRSDERAGVDHYYRGVRVGPSPEPEAPAIAEVADADLRSAVYVCDPRFDPSERLFPYTDLGIVANDWTWAQVA